MDILKMVAMVFFFFTMYRIHNFFRVPTKIYAREWWSDLLFSLFLFHILPPSALKIIWKFSLIHIYFNFFYQFFLFSTDTSVVSKQLLVLPTDLYFHPTIILFLCQWSCHHLPTNALSSISMLSSLVFVNHLQHDSLCIPVIEGCI